MAINEMKEAFPELKLFCLLTSPFMLLVPFYRSQVPSEMTAQPTEGVHTTHGHWSSLESGKKKGLLPPKTPSPHPAAADGGEQDCRGIGMLVSPMLFQG